MNSERMPHDVTIHDLVGSGDIAQVAARLTNDPAAANQVDEEGLTPLHRAAMAGDEAMVGRLIELGAKTDAVDRRGRTPLDVVGLAEHSGRSSNSAVGAVDEWPPETAWKCGRRKRGFGILLGIGSLLLALVLVHPELNGPIGWNRNDTVETGPSGLDYRRGEVIASAGSGDRVLLQKKQADAILLGTESQVARSVSLPNDVVDVARADRDEEFFLLRRHAIDRLDSSEAVRAWLPEPKGTHQAAWPVPHRPATSDLKIEVAACESEPYDNAAAGTTLSIRRLGTSRYEAAVDRTTRLRSWLASPANDRPVTEALITEKYVWTALDGAFGSGNESDKRVQLEARRRGTLESLFPLGGLPIRRFDADRHDHWVSAVDTAGSIHFTRPKISGCDHWYGPYFGDRDPHTAQLRSLDEVRLVGMSAGAAILASPHACFRYDLAKRRIDCLVPDRKIDFIVPIQPSPSSVPDSLEALVLGAGVWGIKTGGNAPSVESLDSCGVAAADYSADGRLCVYVSNPSPAESARGISLIRAVDDGWKTETLMPKTSVATKGAVPRLTGFADMNGRWLFGTAEHGAFLYDPRRHDYADRSRVAGAKVALANAPGRAETLTRFQSLERHGDRVLAIADGRAVQRDAAAGEDHAWKPLLSDDPADCKQVATDGSTAVVLRGNRSLTRVDLPSPDRSAASSSVFGSGDFPPLKSATANVAELFGDLFVDRSQRWRLATLQRGEIGRYESTRAQWTVTRPKWLESVPYPRQMRMWGDSLVFLSPDGGVFDERGVTIFGEGGFPFRPTTATAVCRAHSGSDLLVAGVTGDVLQYSWESGSCRTKGIVPTSSADNPIVELAAAQQGILARTRAGALFASQVGSAWDQIAGYSRWAYDSTRNQWMLAGATDVIRLAPGVFPTAESVKKPESRRSVGTGMRKFVESATAVWPAGPNRVAFFDGESIGVYDALRDSFATRPAGTMSSPTGVDDDSGGAMFIDHGRIVYLDSALKEHFVGVFAHPPQRASATCTAAALTAAGTAAGVLQLCTGQGIDDRNVICSARGGDTRASGLDLNRVVYAEPLAESALLVDGSGNAAVYHLNSGTWSSLSDSSEALRLESRSGSLQDGMLLLTLRHLDGTSRTVVIRRNHGTATARNGQAGSVSATTLSMAPPEDAFAQLASRLRRTARSSIAAGLMDAIADDFARRGKRIGDERRLAAQTPLVQQAGRLKLIRGPNGSSFEISRSGGSEALSFVGNRFAQDVYLDVAVVREFAFALIGDRRTIVRFHQGDRLASFETALRFDEDVLAVERLDKDLLQVRSGNARRLYRVAADGTARETSPAPFHILAAIPHGGYQLDAGLRADDGRIELRWSSAKPVAGTLPAVWSGERFALHDVRDIAVAGKRLLLATAGGVVVRSLDDGRIEGWFPHADAREFLENDAGRLLTFDRPRTAYEWTDPIDPREITGENIVNERALTQGPWTWASQSSPAGRMALTIRHATSGLLRSDRESSPGKWRFADEHVLWIDREPETDALSFATADGMWTFSRTRGRVGDGRLSGRAVEECRFKNSKEWWWRRSDGTWRFVTDADKPVDEFIVAPQDVRPEILLDLPAVKIEAAAGKLRLTAVDGLPVWVDGRFYFDTTEAVGMLPDDAPSMGRRGEGIPSPENAAAPTQGRLYCLIPGRCIAERSTAELGAIVKIWPLPSELMSATDVTLAAADGAVSLVTSATAARDRTWTLRPKDPNASWTSADTVPKVGTRLGPVVWRRLRPGGVFVPELVDVAPWKTVAHHRNGDAPGFAPSWWSNGRFAWDDVTGVGFLAEKMLLVTTVQGAGIWRIEDGAPLLESYGFIPEVSPCRTARNASGNSVGQLFTVGPTTPVAERTTHRYHIPFQGKPAPLQLSLIVSPTAYLHSPALTWETATDALGRVSHVELRSTWVREGSRKPFESNLDSLTADVDLLQDGRFIFDRADAALPLSLGRNSPWLCFAEVGTKDGPRTLFSLNDLTSNNELRLRRFWLERAGLDSLRLAYDGRVLGAWRSADEKAEPEIRARTIPIAESPSDPIDWELSLNTTDSNRFRIGSNLKLDVRRLRWDETPRYPWHCSRPALTTDPADYHLWHVEDGGLAMSFDVYRSLAVYRTADDTSTSAAPWSLSVGTAGGVLTTPLKTNESPERALGGDGARLEFDFGGNDTSRETDIRRLRIGADGRLMIALAAEKSSTVRSFLPRDGSSTNVGEREVGLAVAATSLPQKVRSAQRSDDFPCFWQRRDCRDIIDVHHDDQPGVLWLVTRNDGVFRVVTSTSHWFILILIGIVAAVSWIVFRLRYHAANERPY